MASIYHPLVCFGMVPYCSCWSYFKAFESLVFVSLNASSCMLGFVFDLYSHQDDICEQINHLNEHDPFDQLWDQVYVHQFFRQRILQFYRGISLDYLIGWIKELVKPHLHRNCQVVSGPDWKSREMLSFHHGLAQCSFYQAYSCMPDQSMLLEPTHVNSFSSDHWSSSSDITSWFQTTNRFSLSRDAAYPMG